MLLELLFPPVCVACDRLLRAPSGPVRDRIGSKAAPSLPLCRLCGIDQAPLPPHLSWRGGVQACFPHEGALARAMVRFKYQGRRELAGPLGALLSRGSSLAMAPSGRPWELVVSVPPHWSRRVHRGFDHAGVLTDFALQARTRGRGALRRARRVLRRVRATAPLVELDARARRAELHGAVRCTAPERVAGRRVLVCDDVTTTGATLEACFAALAAAGAREVGGLALLRRLPPSP